MCNFNERSQGFELELQSIGREQLYVHLRCICVTHAPTKPPKNNTYTEDTIWWEPFHDDLLYIFEVMHTTAADWVTDDSDDSP